MHIFAEIQKAQVQADGTLMAYGIASAPVRDAHGEIVTTDAMKNAIGEYMKFPAVREMHGADKAAGTGVDISIDDDGRTLFSAHIVDRDAIDKVKKRVYRGFSIGGKIKERNPHNHSIIDAIDLMEISLVDRPSCPVSTIDLWKRDDVNANDLSKATQEYGDDATEWKDKDRWNDGFDGADAGSSEGPMSVDAGGPYRQQTPADGGSTTEWADKDKWHEGGDEFGGGGDSGRSQMPTDPNKGKQMTTGAPNSTRNTSQGGGDVGGTRRPGASSTSPSDYFTPAPGTSANLKRLFGMIEEMYTAQQNPPVRDATQFEHKAVTVDNIADRMAEERRPPNDFAPYARKRAYTVEQRKAAAHSGAAMGDGSCPIHNRDDLAQAIRSFGKSRNPEATKAHIKRRAGALGAAAMLPAEWGKIEGYSAEDLGGLNNRQRTPTTVQRTNGENDALATKLSKTDDLIENTIAGIERMEMRFKKGNATPESYRLAKLFKEMPVEELAEVLALDTMAKIAKNDAKVVDAEALAKKYEEDNKTLLAKLDTTQKGLETLSARVAKLAEMPMPQKTAGSVFALDKEGDLIGGGARGIQAEQFAKAQQTLENMSDEERAMLLTKVALSHPRRMNMTPLPNPPRSIGGAAGRSDNEIR